MAELDRNAEIELLKALSDFMPMNQNELTEAMGGDRAKSTDRVKVHRVIQRINKHLERVPPKVTKVGKRWMQEMGNIWVLRKKLETIMQLVLEYPEILPTLQLNDVILSMLVDKHINKVCSDEWLSDEQIHEFKNRLAISATFFRLYLLEDPPKLRNTIFTLFTITERGQEFERLNRGEIESEPKPLADLITKYGFTPYKPSFNDILDVTFRTCVGADILYGRDCSAGIEFIKKMKLPDYAGGLGLNA